MKNRSKFLQSRCGDMAAFLLLVLVMSVAGVAKPPAKRAAAKKRQLQKYTASGPSGSDQVLTAVYDSATNALRVEGSGSVGGSGTVTSVGLSLPSIFTVSGSPVTTSGTLSGSLSSQNANQVLASPSGSSGTPGFRSLTLGDLPAISFTNLTGTVGDAQLANAYSGVGSCPANQFAITLSRNAAPTCAPAVVTSSAPANQFATGISATGALSYAQPSFANLSGTATLAQLPATLTTLAGTITAGDCAKWSSSGVLTDAGAPCGSGGGGSGTVTSVGLSLPSIFTISGSPVTASGTLTGTLANQGPNLVFAGPSSGTAAAPAFRALTLADLPAISFSNLSGTASASQLPSPAGDVTGIYAATTVTGLHFGSTGIALGTVPASGQCLEYNGTNISGAACSGGSGAPGGANTSVQFNNSGAFGGDATNFSYNSTTHALTLTGTVTANGFISTGTGAGSTTWTTGAMSVGSSGTVTCGANTGNIFSCSDNGGSVIPLPFLAQDLGGTQAAPLVIGVHASSPVQLNNQPETVQFTNDATTGTVYGELVKITNTGSGSTGTAIETANADTSGIVGICVLNCGKAGAPPVEIAVGGQAFGFFDGAPGAAGDYVINSSTAAPELHDAGSPLPSSGEVIGRTLGGLTSSAPGTPILGTASGTDSGTTKCAGGTCYVKLTYINGYGSTLGSAEQSQAVTNGNLLTVSYPASSAPSNTTGWCVYVGLSSGTEAYQQCVYTFGSGVGWTEPTGGLNTNTQDPFGNVVPPSLNEMAVSLTGKSNGGSSGGGSFTAGGDLNGSSTSQNVIGLHFGATATPLSSTAPTTGQYLEFNGTNIVGASAPSGNATQIQGINVSSTAPTNGQVLQYNSGSTQYVPTTLSGGSSATLYSWEPFPGSSVGATGLSANHVYVSAITNWPAAAIQFSFIDINISTADTTGGDVYAVGIYGPCAPGAASCPLIAGNTAVAFSAAGFHELSPTQATPITASAITTSGQYYYVAWTGNAATAQIDAENGRYFTPVCSANSATTSSGGALPSTITIPSASWGVCGSAPVFHIHN